MKTPQHILIWLPSPLGDAICATPALRALRHHFADAQITFLAAPFTQAILSPTVFADSWLNPAKGLHRQVRQLRSHRFDTTVLLKNSFGSALTARLAGIERRIGYLRDGRSFLLTDGIVPQKDKNRRFKPIPSVRYYLTLAESLGAKPTTALPELTVAPADQDAIDRLFPHTVASDKPLVILVPGGAFGPSKLWPAQRFAACAEALIERHNAHVIVSVSPTTAERQAAEAICAQCRFELAHLGNTPLTGGQLKALFSRAALVLTNDTGPRHIAIALRRKVVTLFGPNNPAWTHTDYPDEIRIVGRGPCVPCDKPICRAKRHYCMKSITVEEVLQAAETLLSRGRNE
jgi:heptosyltransferase-2